MGERQVVEILPYVVLKNIVSKDFVDEIVEIGETLDTQDATVTLNGERQKVKKETRISEVSFFDDEDQHYIEEILKPIVRTVNHLNNWNVKFFDDYNYAQYTKYNVGGYYKFHMDNRENINKNRKISMTLLLNDSRKDFEGGEFEFKSSNESSIILDELTDRGDMVIFPSHLVHRVNPITKGVRKSLVMWWTGEELIDNELVVS